jgi:hypothetical protein
MKMITEAILRLRRARCALVHRQYQTAAGWWRCETCSPIRKRKLASVDSRQQPLPIEPERAIPA